MDTMQIETNLFRTESSWRESSLEFDVEHVECVAVVRIRGEADCESVSELHEQLMSAQRPGCSFVILDLAGLNRISAEALQFLKEFSQDVGHEGVEVWLTDLQPAVWFALHAARLARWFTIRAMPAEVLASV